MKKVLLLLLIITNSLCGQQFNKEIFIHKKDSLPYRILLPKNYNSQKLYPMLIFLHGAGERGDDNELQLIHGGSLFKSNDFRNNYPAIVVFPQCPEKSFWANVKRNSDKDIGKKFDFIDDIFENKQLEMVERLLTFIEKKYKIDTTKRYVGGLSMGGMGTFELVARNPDYFAAAFPICGGGNPKWANLLKSTPFWIFHGEDDSVVSVDFSRKMFEALSQVNASVRLTIYPGVNHNSWDNSFQDPDLINWLFLNKRKNKRKHSINL
ncbi:MAG: alpha/beta hydrolase-fold protein [Bacteroidota bacterium]|nr:alpha/beta hydrolase-fold protein [Bacteroidota bacterium]|tara:strand:+ start:1913 stop:2707 length:795 start_codon:yes stop_codon:yes gene_type:complete